MKKRIAIILDVKKYDWNGGINYFNNLIKSLSHLLLQSEINKENNS